MRMRAKYIMCGKVVHLGDDVIKELDKLRSEYHVSYTGAIRLLLQREPRDIRLLLINRAYEELKRVVPEMQDLLEYQRVITVRFYLLKEEKREKMRGNLRNLLEEALKEVVRGDESK